MVKLSVLIITFNEERNIRDCLESVKEFADEIVVLDSYSTDDTEKICSEYDVKFLQHKFDGYVEQKNRVLEEAQYDYILSLDADERISAELQQEIKKLKENPTYEAYQFNRITFYNGRWIKHSGWYPDIKIRLWKKGIGRWGGRNPHDRFEMKKATKVKHLKGDILHYSFYSIEEHLNQTNKFSTIGAQALFEEGKNAHFLKLYFSPLIKFMRDYIKNMGFLDGVQGLTICRINALGTYLKYAKLKELNRKEKLKKLNN
jgi:glycosyltransferase involved in cell wall biosynthesis